MAALAQLNQLAGSVGAAERLTATGGLQGQSWYPQAQGFRPVIGGPGTYTGSGLGSGAFPGNGAGPSGLHSHVSGLCRVRSISSSCFEKSVIFPFSELCYNLYQRYQSRKAKGFMSKCNYKE